MCACRESLLARYLLKHLGEFHQICNFGAGGNKDELIRFWARKVKGQGHESRLYQTWSTNSFCQHRRSSDDSLN